jgi:hypothetical protein
MSQEVISKTEEPLWLITYDVESENGKHLTPDQKHWLRIQRVQIWYTLRYKFKKACVPLQNSIWLIRDIKNKDILEKMKNDWLIAYQQGGFKATIQIFPIVTSDVGYETFKTWEFKFITEWLGKIVKSLVKSSEVGKIARKSLLGHTKKIQLLEGILREDFDETFPNWNLAQDDLAIVWDLSLRAKSYVTD